MKKILSLAAVLATALFISTACQTASTTSVDNTKANNANISAPPAASQTHTDDAPRIVLADAKKDFDAGNALFVDTRPASAYETEHIKGSINVTTNDLNAKIKELQTDKKIIAYCS